MHQLRRRLPVLVWLPYYTKSQLVGDVVAGLTVATMVVPQVSTSVL